MLMGRKGGAACSAPAMSVADFRRGIHSAATLVEHAEDNYNRRSGEGVPETKNQASIPIMADKFEFYDVLGVLVPGVLIVYVFLVCFPGVATLVPPRMSDALNTIAFTAMTIFVGQLVLAVGSLVEGLLYKTWGGRPSERALHSGLGHRYLPAVTAKRIRTKLKQVAGENATDRDLFIYAMGRAEGANSVRVSKFNALFAYHRALLVLCLVAFILVVASSFVGALAILPRWKLVLLAGAAFIVFILVWHRTRQRAYYYVREVLLTAERVLDAPTNPPAKAS